MKLASTVLRFFPVPRTLSMPAVGVDISNESVKYISFKHEGGLTVPDRVGKLPLAHGVVEQGLIQNPAELTTVLKKIQQETRVSFAQVSLPEEHAYLFELSLPKNDELAIEQAIEFRLKENVPMSPDEVIIDYVELKSSNESKLDLSVSVYPTRIVSQFLSVFLDAGLTPLSFEIEAQAIARALVPDEKMNQTAMLVDIGASAVGLSIVSGGILEYTATLDTAGGALAEAIEKELGVTGREAEDLMFANGLYNTPENKKIFEAMFPVVQVLCDEINKHLSYWNAHQQGELLGVRDIDTVILCGGNAIIKGLPQYLTTMLSVPVTAGNVWVNLFPLDEYLPQLSYRESIKYATAVGLTLRTRYREGDMS